MALTKERLEEFTHLTAKQAAEKLGYSLANIYAVAKYYGLSFSKKRPLKEELEKVCHLDANQIAEKYQVTTHTVRLWAKFYGLKITRKEVDRIRPSRVELEKIMPLSQKQVAEIYGVTIQSVSLWGEKYGLTFLPTRNLRRKIRPPKEDIKDIPISEVVDKYKVCRGTVRKWRKEYGLCHQRATKEEVEKLSHLKQVEISKILGVSQSVVSSLMKEYGLKSNKGKSC